MFKANLRKDIPASIAVFLVAVPLCLGIALASEGAPLISGLIAGMVGGLIVGPLSGSHISVSGPAAGLVAIVITAIAEIGSYEAFLVATIIAGGIQLAMSLLRAGGIAHYVPNSVIKGLLAAIGIILILKQIPHAVGWDADAEGDFSFLQADGENTFSELWAMTSHLHWGAIVVALLCFAILIGWKYVPKLRDSVIPVQLGVVVLAVVANRIFGMMDSSLWLEATHRVALPSFDGFVGFAGILPSPDFSAFTDPAVYKVAITIAAVASLESLLNLEAADKLDPHKRVSNPNRELFAQGVGNMASGALGGLPVTSVVVRSTVNTYSGAETRYSAIFHGVWIVIAVVLFPDILRNIPLSALAAILVFTGFKLASPQVFTEMWRKGWSQFLPFFATVTAIVFTDLLIGVLIGLAVGLAAVIQSLVRTPFLSTVTAEEEGAMSSGLQPPRLAFAQHLTFLHRAQLIRTLENIPNNSQLVLDASKTESIGPEILEILVDFHLVQAPERDIEVSLVGFDEFEDELKYVDVVTQDRQAKLSPEGAVTLLKEGNERFVSGKSVERNLQRQVELTEKDQYPVAAVLGCIDSRVPHEMLFDQGLGDLFSARVAGNVLNDEVIASLEYAAAVAKVKAVVVLGHTGCGAVKAACQNVEMGHITKLLKRIRPAVDEIADAGGNPEDKDFADRVSRANVLRVYKSLLEQSPILKDLVDNGEMALVPAIYHLSTGKVEFMTES